MKNFNLLLLLILSATIMYGHDFRIYVSEKNEPMESDKLVPTCQSFLEDKEPEPLKYVKLGILSPDSKLNFILEENKNYGIVYKLYYDGKALLNQSNLGFLLKDGARLVCDEGWTIDNVESVSVSEKWYPVWGKRSVVDDVYNQKIFHLRSSGSEISRIDLIVRAYNDGVAFRYAMPENVKSDVEVEKELTTFNFAGDFTAWFYNFENHNIGPEKLSETDQARYPVMTIKADEDCYMAIHEADLKDGEPMVLCSEQGSTSFSILSKPSKLFSGYVSSWRTIMCAPEIGNLVDTHLLELLNPEPDEDYDFKSWVKPGIALWDWRINGAEVDDFTYGMNYLSWQRMIDFADKNDIMYLVLDANWYGPEFESDSDPLKGDKVNDVKKIISYAKERGIGIWLYLNDIGGREYPIEETLKNYSDWGAVGVKYGFMQGDSEEKNIRTQMITRLCAKYRLFINFHDGPVHPYGQMRTWPNALTREYCQAQLDAHKVFYPGTFVTSVFVNMIAGPIDMNNGMFDLRQGPTTRVDENTPVPSTVVSEAARTLIVFSGATIIPDIPEYYNKYPELLQFISSEKMPWLESKTLYGRIGEYIVMMRETEEAYLVGAATNENERQLSIKLDFLSDDKDEYNAIIVEDGDGADYLTNREVIKSKSCSVKQNDVITVSLARGGGACILVRK